VEAREFSFLQKKKSRPVLGPTQPPAQRVPGPFFGVKLPGCNVDHPPPSSADVKNEWNYTPTPPYAFMALKGKVFALNFT